jgi:hypothetical protein
MVAVLVAAAAPAPATNLFSGRKNNITPEQRVDQLLMQAQTATETYKRCDAIEELRDFNTTTFPQIVPILVDILHQDKNPSVRAEAARSLGRLRPLTKMAGDALSEAASKDSALRVRWQARTSLAVFNVAGWKSSNHDPAEKQPYNDKGKIELKEVKGAPADGQIIVPQQGGALIGPNGNPSSGGNFGLPMPKGPEGQDANKAPVPLPLPPASNVPPAPTPPQAAPMPLPAVPATVPTQPPQAAPIPMVPAQPPQAAPMPLPAVPATVPTQPPQAAPTPAAPVQPPQAAPVPAPNPTAPAQPPLPIPPAGVQTEPPLVIVPDVDPLPAPK